MTAHGIKKKTDYEHIRLRVPMYLGSPDAHTQTILEYDKLTPVSAEVTWTPALYTCIRELIDNALDEVVGHGYGDRIDISYNEQEMIFEIRDNGRGIPFDFDENHQQYLATMVLTEPRAGRNFDERGEVAGVNGIGASAVAITAEWFTVEIVRDGKKFVQTFREGDTDSKEISIGLPDISIPKAKEISGTLIRFHPSKSVYKSRLLSDQFIRSRVTEVAICNPLIKVYYQGEQIKVKPRPEQSLFPNMKPMAIEIKEDTFRSRFWIVPNWVDGGEHVHTIVNNIPAFNGGVHIDTFRRLFYGNLLTALERESKRRKLTPNRSDVTEGVLIYNITNMRAPNFDSQSKTRLINEEVGTILKKELDNPELYKEFIRKNKDWIEEIYKRCEARTMKKDASDTAKAAKKNLRNKVPSLMDAIGPDRSKCILFLAEGESAISGMSSVRDPEIHGGLALTGKVLNVNGEMARKVIENKALANIMNSLGLIIGQKAKISDMRYGKVYVAHDMDPDGLNIGALLINFFHTYWPELFDPKNAAFLHIFRTPFIIAEKGKVRKYWYAHNYQNFKAEAYSGWSITRAKGLGTLTREDWEYSLKNPEVYAVVDDGNINETLDLIFNSKRSDDRKTWIGL